MYCKNFPCVNQFKCPNVLNSIAKSDFKPSPSLPHLSFIKMDPAVMSQTSQVLNMFYVVQVNKSIVILNIYVIIQDLTNHPVIFGYNHQFYSEKQLVLKLSYKFSAICISSYSSVTLIIQDQYVYDLLKQLNIERPFNKK
jgi:hypothetical protein